MNTFGELVKVQMGPSNRLTGVGTIDSASSGDRVEPDKLRRRSYFGRLQCNDPLMIEGKLSRGRHARCHAGVVRL